MAASSDQVVLLECNIDDMTGEELGEVLANLMAAGALDAWMTPIQMKKGRPAVTVSVLGRVEFRDELAERMMRETSTLGVRWRLLERQVAERRIVEVVTPWGVVRCKLKIVDQRVVSVKAEHEDCLRLAKLAEAELGRGLGALEQVRVAAEAQAQLWLGQAPPS
jgi:hypothetical protein